MSRHRVNVVKLSPCEWGKYLQFLEGGKFILLAVVWFRLHTIIFVLRAIHVDLDFLSPVFIRMLQLQELLESLEWLGSSDSKLWRLNANGKKWVVGVTRVAEKSILTVLFDVLSLSGSSGRASFNILAGWAIAPLVPSLDLLFFLFKQ